MRVQQHWDKDDEIAQKDRREGLLTVHAAGDEAGRKHVGRHPHRHGEPERDVAVGTPGALLGRGGRQVRVVERRVGAQAVGIGQTGRPLGVKSHRPATSRCSDRPRSAAAIRRACSTASSPRERTWRALPASSKPSKMEELGCIFRAAAVIVYFANGVPQQNIRDGTGGHNPILRNPDPYPNRSTPHRSRARSFCRWFCGLSFMV